MEQERFGTDTPVYNKSLYNSRGQLAEIRVSTYSLTAAGHETDWNRGAIINHYSNAAGAWGATGGGPDNNGNLKKQEIYIPDNDQITSYTNVVQQYSYDALNRLTSVYDKPFNGSPDFIQGYSYDRFGNRTIDQTLTTSNAPKPQYTASATTNRLSPPSGYTMTYDDTGNLTFDNYSGGGTRTYDAENRMTSAQFNASQTASYTYDADGHRTRHNTGSGEVWQIYGIGGELLAEYAPNASPSSPQKEYGYHGGELLVTAEPSSNDTVWVEDSLPAGAVPAGDTDGWNWASSNPAPYSGSSAHQSSTVAGLHQHFFYNATSTLSAGAGEKLVAYVYLDPSNAPTEVMLQWNDGTWEHRAYWGANQIGWGADGTDSRRYMGALPATGQWVRLEVPASQVGLEGHTLNGMAFTLYGGKATWDRAGKSSGGTGAGVQWLIADQLGTPRMVIDKTGSLSGVKRHDYFPFGEEIMADASVRTIQRGYVADNVRQKFTSYERDNESSLDYAKERYFSSTQGRFTSVDPGNIGADEADPQSWNGYSYCLNNPLLYTDPSGLVWVHDTENNLYIWVPDEEFKEGNEYFDNAERYRPLGPDEIGPGGITFVFTRGDYTELYPELVGKRVYLGEDGKFHEVDSGILLAGAVALPLNGATLGSSLLLDGPEIGPVDAAVSVVLLYYILDRLGPPHYTGPNTATNSNLAPPPTLPNASVNLNPNIYAKGGRQNIRNDWNDRAQQEVGNDIDAQRRYLKEQYDKATGEIREKIKKAQKAIGGRRSTGGGGKK